MPGVGRVGGAPVPPLRPDAEGEGQCARCNRGTQFVDWWVFDEIVRKRRQWGGDESRRRLADAGRGGLIVVTARGIAQHRHRDFSVVHRGVRAPAKHYQYQPHG
jgi:hypothetical protein